MNNNYYCFRCCKCLITLCCVVYPVVLLLYNSCINVNSYRQRIIVISSKYFSINTYSWLNIITNINNTIYMDVVNPCLALR